MLRRKGDVNIEQVQFPSAHAGEVHMGWIRLVSRTSLDNNTKFIR